ncbi:MAG: peptidase M24 [Acidobacteria bacterium 13_1_40CM_65_14]|nr:MAG: peptidase M24 [Acidobacteria bacterium 13_1_40CM_65_14]OLC81648.1 MAG: peptidase M24 [Acidobacteria bacterium 13_1_40CM_4_65_8]OLD17993.1 MAG: peptidase M24 [Acidobacteria bacterium 13_1_40CM_3_65_5]OLE84953.1 MAG: peptidase M24 [Acidobacteria bacterium 13_1_20CM_2_65_9]
MLNRRSFLWLTSVAAGLSVVRVSAQRGRSEAEPSGPLPPSIAALTSMRAKAKPTTAQERRGRLDKARRLMTEQKIDAIILAGGTSLTYFTGIRWGNSERLFAVVIPKVGNPYIVTPAFEEDRTREQLAGGPMEHTDVAIWQEDESPFALVAQGLKDRGIATGRIGVEETTKFVFADTMGDAAPALNVVSATPVTAGCRMIKDAHEIELMKVACEATLKCYEAVYHALKPRMTQNDVGALLTAGFGRLGFPGGASVQVGEYTALPHGSIAPQTIREGTIIMMDNGCSAEGYQSDITRTYVLGKATDKMKKVFDIVHQAQTAALKFARPGVALEGIDAAARNVIVDAGYGPGFKFFTHRLGHGMGMDGHEWPYLVKNNMFGWEHAMKAQPGMVFSDEPGIYIRGEFGVRLEDDMFITENGAELMTPQSPSIEDPFGKTS